MNESLYIINKGVSLATIGGGLPFYDIESKRGSYHLGALVCPGTNLLPFQLITEDTDGIVFELVNSVSGHVITLDSTLIQKLCTSDNRSLLMYNGEGIDSNKLVCGIWHVRLTGDFGSVWSCDVEIVNEESELIKVSYKDSKEWLGYTYFENGFNPFFYFKSKLNRVKTESFKEEIENGQGDKFPSFQRLVEQHSFDIKAPNWIIYLLNSIGFHDTIRVSFLDTNAVFDVFNFRFTDNGDKTKTVWSGLIQFEMNVLIDNCGSPEIEILDC